MNTEIEINAIKLLISELFKIHIPEDVKEQIIESLKKQKITEFSGLNVAQEEKNNLTINQAINLIS